MIFARPNFINIVGTDAGDGNHDRFNRWYSDHIHQLMKFPAMHSATRLRRISDSPALPEYLCLYEFGSPEDFQAYNNSAEFQAAERDRAEGWGERGVTNRLRVQYERIGHFSR